MSVLSTEICFLFPLISCTLGCFFTLQLPSSHGPFCLVIYAHSQCFACCCTFFHLLLSFLLSLSHCRPIISLQCNFLPPIGLEWLQTIDFDFACLSVCHSKKGSAPQSSLLLFSRDPRLLKCIAFLLKTRRLVDITNDRNDVLCAFGNPRSLATTQFVVNRVSIVFIFTVSLSITHLALN